MKQTVNVNKAELMKNYIKKIFAMLGILLFKVQGQIEDRTLPTFATYPKRLKINLPRNIANPQHIYIGDNVKFGPGCFLLALTEYPTSKMRNSEFNKATQKFNPVIKIGDNVTATAYVQISALERITIEDDVMFASNVFVGDHQHGYQSAATPYKYQPIWKINPITIKKGCWIGQNVIVMPGVTIGECSIIGANSLVNKDIPPKCIAVGSPATVIKKWDDQSQIWIKS
ncbi:acyltransferase [Desulfonatronospira thiodismutans]|uniref:acyltransferase n=1 Tax=Desulfonatronospira thiodismutans TaxID=488939 RepID=UPI000680E3B2|nr:acyltransferase [Desulfonatronospira thiodismutans]